MNKALILSLLVALTGCYPTSQAASIVQPSQSNEVDLKNLELKVDALQSTLNKLVERDQLDRKTRSEVTQCVRVCEKRYSNIDWESLDSEDRDKMLKYRDECYQDCNRNTPDDLIIGC